MTAQTNPPMNEPIAARWGWLHRGLSSDRTILISSIFLIAVILSGALAPVIAPGSATQVDLSQRLIPPEISGGFEHILGTDALGRDVLSRILFGLRSSLIIGVSVVLIAGLLGSGLGLIAGFYRGWVDTLIMRLVDAQFAFPGLLLVIVVVGVLGPSVGTITVVLTIYGWMIFARLVRGNVLQLKETLYVRSAEHIGASSSRIMRVHLLPVLVAPIATQGMLELARVMLVEASLSYLGLGIQPPDVSLGLMVAENQVYMRDGWWTVLFPGLTLALVILALNTLMASLRAQAGRSRLVSTPDGVESG